MIRRTGSYWQEIRLQLLPYSVCAVPYIAVSVLHQIGSAAQSSFSKDWGLTTSRWASTSLTWLLNPNVAISLMLRLVCHLWIYHEAHNEVWHLPCNLPCAVKCLSVYCSRWTSSFYARSTVPLRSVQSAVGGWSAPHQRIASNLFGQSKRRDMSNYSAACKPQRCVV